MEKKLCHNCLGDMYPNGNGWKCRSCGVCMDANGRHFMPAPSSLTNADRIRAMSGGVLAQSIMTVSNGYAPWCDHHCKHLGEDGCCDCIRNWLRQPVQSTPDAPDTHEDSGLLEEE